MASMPRTTRPTDWWFVSDLHLDPGGPDGSEAGEALAELIDRVVLPRVLEHDQKLVLLGDSFELRRRPGEPRPLERRLRSLVISFPEVFEALDRCLRSGAEVHLVCGHHDYALMSPVCRALLRSALGEPDPTADARLHVHPWVLHRPGLFYAEHGNQHHDLNRLPLLLLAGDPEVGDGLPPTPLDAWGRTGPRRFVSLHRTVRLGKSLAAARRAERDSAAAAYTALLVDQGPWGMSGDLARALNDVSRFDLARSVTRTGRRVSGRWAGRDDPDGYLRAATARIDEVLSRHGERPRYYVFGHTHAEALDELPSGGAWYANAGTWSRHAVASSGRRPDRFPFLHLLDPGPEAEPAMRLSYWDASRREVVATAR